MRKGIIIGIGTLIILLALAGTASAHTAFGFGCTNCHTGYPTPLKANGTLFNDTHKFNGSAIPDLATGCTTCHVNPSGGNYALNSTGQNYSGIHNGVNTSGYARTVVNCTYCHTDPAGLGDFSFLTAGTTFRQIHKFNGVMIPSNATSCVACHTDVMSFLPLTTRGTNYSSIHRYNATMLASELLTPPGCYNCHVDNGSNFTPLISGTATYLTSTTCEACHKAKYDNWTNTMHRVILTPNTTAAAMNLSLPANYTWANFTFVVVGKSSMYYLNETGYRTKKYNVVSQNFSNTSGNYTSCPACHTTGYNLNGDNSSLPGTVGNWSEPGIGCENCHGPGGNGHNVTVYSKGEDCIKCHYGTSRQGPAMTNRHATAPAEESTSSSCTFCHSPYDKYKKGAASSLDTAANVTCSVCHNPHNTSDDKYSDLLKPNGFNATDMSVVGEVKLSFFNGTASNASRQAGSNASLTAGNDIYDTLTSPALFYPGSVSSRKDSSYGSAPINVTGPISEVLCSLCHYRHGLGHIAGVNLTHGRNNANSTEWATCTDCHMSKAGGLADHSFDAENQTNYPGKTCSKGTNCHVTSSQNLSASNLSIVPVKTEWEDSLHNESNGFFKNVSYFETKADRRNTSCQKCHSPSNWNPLNESDIIEAADFKGVTCDVCHNIHDMGDSITNSGGKKYSWYNRDAVPVLNTTTGNITRYKANYTLMANTTELCGNCHASVRIGRDGPGWVSATSTTPIKTHGFPAKDIFVGSWKQSSMLNFECIDCHLYINKTNATGGIANDTEKITGHSFAVNESGLQNKPECYSCHVNGTKVDTIANVVAKIQADTHTKWNATNITVQNALTAVISYTGVNTSSRDKIAQAYWNLKLVESDASWGVHDPVGTTKLLDDAAALAIAANASLGQGLVSTVNLTGPGWNLKSLKGTPTDTSSVSVMSSVSSNITVVWGYNTSSVTKWELYDPHMPSTLNSLKNIVRGQGYWIYAEVNTVWTV